ncbi:MAG: recombinase family protein [Breznakia sp.]
MAEFYSKQLAANIQRGMNYNTERTLYNGNKVFGYGVDDNKKYVIDGNAAPFVQMMFADYAAGKPMQEICNKHNAQGVRTVRGKEFGVKTLNKMLKNKVYIGEYYYGQITIENDVPAIIDEATFDKVQTMLALNKRNASQRKTNKPEDAPRYWLTGKLFCG